MTNEVPKFVDSSGALASRFILLVLTTSFFGKENPALTDELLEEAPGIFNWCLEGWDRLVARGYFVQPDSARDALRRLEDLSSPVSAFARDRCAIGPTHEVEKDTLWDEWKRWSEDEGRSRPGTKTVFARDLHAAFPSIRSTRPSRDGKRIHLYEGIGLGQRGDDEDPDQLAKQQWTGPLTTPDQPDPVRDPVTDGVVQNRRSEPLVRGGQGLDALYSPQDQIPDQTPDQEPGDADPFTTLYARIDAAVQAAAGNLFVAARELNDSGVPSGDGPWTAVKIARARSS